MASIFGAAFDKLPDETQRNIRFALQVRKHRYTQAMRRGYSPTKVVLLGDTPGPGRPSTLGYHHTPFYSTKNSSLWLNKLLVEHRVNEQNLLWFNTTLADGTALDPIHLSDVSKLCKKPAVICLGGAAERWLKDTAKWDGQYIKVHHPQAWKRFHSKDPYPLLGHLQHILDL